jgi:hypothetical protein
MTSSQLAMLRAVARFGGRDAGWAEVELQWSSERGIPDYLVASTAVRVGNALVAAGLIVDDAGPALTDAGRAALEAP